MSKSVLLVAFLLISPAAFADSGAGSAPATPGAGQFCHEYDKSIGKATMAADGTITLELIACDPATGAIGNGYFTIAPGAPNYQATIDHVGGLKPGETKNVPPWPAQ